MAKSDRRQSFAGHGDNEEHGKPGNESVAIRQEIKETRPSGSGFQCDCGECIKHIIFLSVAPLPLLSL
jgi:hypothetical protein